ncbi:MAG: hypothetical protein ACJ768_15715, partial [Gaiellaceae bacterium]
AGRESHWTDDRFRRTVADLMHVTLGPDDPNPWGLPTSIRRSDWGVSSETAQATLPSVVAFATPEIDVILEVVHLNEIPFDMYEDAASDLVSRGAVVGMSFDYAQVHHGSPERRPTRRAYHLARLTPLGAELERQPNILSPEFRFDYEGRLWVFDDSLEMSPDESLVDWPQLVRASRQIDGSFWGVRRA